MTRKLAILTFGVVLGLTVVFTYGRLTTDEQRLLVTRSSWNVYHDYSWPTRYFVTRGCTAPAIRARATLDIDFTLHFESGERCEVSSILLWGVGGDSGVQTADLLLDHLEQADNIKRIALPS